MKFKLFTFAAILLILSQSIAAQTERDERLDKLVLETKALKITAKQTDSNFVDLMIEIENTFTNKGDETIIILQPYDEKSEDPFWFAGVTLTTKDLDSSPEYPIYSFSALPSNCRGCRKKFDKKLDKKMPAAELTRRLRKNDSWKWKTSIYFRMPANGKNYYNNWEATKKLTKIKAAITYSMFPSNSLIGEKIKKRWESFGILFVSETHSLITSEPFEIDFRNLEIQK